MAGVSRSSTRASALCAAQRAAADAGRGLRWLEGPVWFADQDCLLVSDLPNDRILRWSEAGGSRVFRAAFRLRQRPRPRPQGRLIGCSHRHRRITRTELDGHDHGAGQPLRRQAAECAQRRRLQIGRHDLVQRSASTASAPTMRAASRRPNCRRALSPRSARRPLRVMADDFDGAERARLLARRAPALRRRDRRAVRADPVAAHPRCSTVGGDGRLSRGRVFHTFRPAMPTGSGSTRTAMSGARPPTACIASPRTAAARHGSTRRSPVSNLAFGGRNRARLFLCASHTLLAIYTKPAGAARP